jgi:hypothetical protein
MKSSSPPSDVSSNVPMSSPFPLKTFPVEILIAAADASVPTCVILREYTVPALPAVSIAAKTAILVDPV